MRSPYALLTLAMLCWSGNILLGRAMHAVFTPTELSFWRWATATAILLPFVAVPLWSKRGILRKEWRVLVGLGLLGVAGFNWLLYQALRTTTATNAALIFASTPIFIVSVSWIFLGERATPRQLLGIALSTAGVAAVITRADRGLMAEWRVQPGDLWALATVPVWGLYTLLLRRRPKALRPLELQGAIMVPGVAVLLPLYLWSAGGDGGVEWSAGSIAAVGYLAVFASIVAFVLWNVGVEAVGANIAGLFTHLYPLFATVLAIFFLGESLFLYHLAGGALIFTGLYFTTVSGGWLRRGT